MISIGSRRIRVLQQHRPRTSERFPMTNDELASELELLGQMLGDLADDRKSGKILISAADRLRKLAKDSQRLDFLKDHTHYEFWVHHPDYDTYGGKRFSSEGIVIRQVVDSAIGWFSAKTKIP